MNLQGFALLVRHINTQVRSAAVFVSLSTYTAADEAVVRSRIPAGAGAKGLWDLAGKRTASRACSSVG